MYTNTRSQLQARVNRLSKHATITREQAIEALYLGETKGNGGEGVGYMLFGFSQKKIAQPVGDLAVDLGRFYEQNPTAQTIEQTNKILVQAINPTHQPTVNRAVKKLIKYNELNELRNIADDNAETKLFPRLNKQCQKAFDEYQEVLYELPEREQINIEKSNIY